MNSQEKYAALIGTVRLQLKQREVKHSHAHTTSLPTVCINISETAPESARTPALLHLQPFCGFRFYKNHDCSVSHRITLS